MEASQFMDANGNLGLERALDAIARAIAGNKDTTGFYQVLARTTLTANGNTISVPAFTATKYIKIIASASATGGTISIDIRFNNDSGNNYSVRSSTNGAADATGVNNSAMNISGAAAYVLSHFQAEFVNLAGAEKNAIGTRSGNFSAAGAGTAPDKAEIVGKWANTLAQVSRVDLLNLSGTGNFAIGSEVIVLGHN